MKGTTGSSVGAVSGPAEPRSGNQRRGGGPRMRAGDDGPAPGSVPTAPTKTVVGEGQHQRTDFVILLMWQEPTPSDKLREIGNRK